MRNARLTATFLAISTLLSAMLIVRTLYSQDAETPTHGVFNIAPINVEVPYLYPNEQSQVEGLKDIVDVVGQERSISRILDKLHYGKDMPDVDEGDYQTQKSHEIYEAGKARGLSAVECSAEYELFMLNFGKYADKALGSSQRFNAIVLLKKKYFGDKLVFVAKSGYIELELTGPDSGAKSSQDAEPWNRVVKATIVGYESKAVRVYLFDDGGRLRETYTLFCEEPFDFYDVLSQNDVDALEKMKDSDALEYCVRAYQDKLPKFDSIRSRNLVWNENGRLIEKRDSYAPYGLIAEKEDAADKYCYPLTQPVSCASRPCEPFFKPAQTIDVQAGLTDEERKALTESLATYNALATTTDVYQAPTTLAGVPNGFLPQGDNGENEIVFLSIEGGGRTTMMKLGTQSRMLNFFVSKSKAQDPTNALSAEPTLDQFFSIVRDEAKLFLYAFNGKTGSLTGSTTVQRLDPEAKTIYNTYIHDQCKNLPDIAWNFGNFHILTGKPLVAHSCAFNEDGEIREEKSSKPDDPDARFLNDFLNEPIK